MRATLIHNPTAGDEGPSAAELEEIVAHAGFQVRYESIKKGWKKALKKPTDLVIAAGGDGTVAKILKELRGSGRPMAVLPIGTANNIARTLGVVGDAHELVAGWRKAQPKAFDIGLAVVSDEEHFFVEGAGGGIFAEAIVQAHKPVDETGSIAGNETDRALVLLRRLVEEAPPHKWNVVIDGEDLSGEYLAVEAMNVGHVGPSVPIAPDADPGDGLLEVVLVRPGDRKELIKYFDERLAQHEVKLPNLTVHRGRRIVVSTASGPLRIDDEIVKTLRRLDIRVLPGAAQVLLAG